MLFGNKKGLQDIRHMLGHYVLLGVKPVISEFKRKSRKCKVCNKIYNAYEEKQTDVQIAINLFKESINDSYDKAMIVTGDSDLIPAIETDKEKLPKKEIKVIPPTKSKYFSKTSC